MSNRFAKSSSSKRPTMNAHADDKRNNSTSKTTVKGVGAVLSHGDLIEASKAALQIHYQHQNKKNMIVASASSSSFGSGGNGNNEQQAAELEEMASTIAHGNPILANHLLCMVSTAARTASTKHQAPAAAASARQNQRNYQRQVENNKNDGQETSRSTKKRRTLASNTCVSCTQVTTAKLRSITDRPSDHQARSHNADNISSTTVVGTANNNNGYAMMTNNNETYFNANNYRIEQKLRSEWDRMLHLRPDTSDVDGITQWLLKLYELAVLSSSTSSAVTDGSTTTHAAAVSFHTEENNNHNEGEESTNTSSSNSIGSSDEDEENDDEEEDRGS